MKKNLLLVVLLASNLSFSQTKKTLTDADKLNKCIAANTSYFTFNGQQPVGKGWDTLENLFADNQFVAWGEYHNSPLLSQLTACALASASKHGYKKWCVETGPFAASELMRISRAESPADTLEQLYRDGYPQIGTFPFFSTREDAQMLLAANKFNFTIWGIDQEFQMSFPYCLGKVYYAQSNNLRQRYKAVYDSLQARWWYPSTQLLDSFRNVIPQRRYKTVLNAVNISKEIYRNNDNAGRAILMKNNFFKYYDHASKNEKVFFKMGNNHLAKGMNLQTNLYDIGNAVYELAQHNKTGFANVYLMVRYTFENAKLVDDFVSDEKENPSVFLKLYDKDKWVLLDLRPLKVRYDNSLSRDAYQVIEKYDYVLISPEILKIEERKK
ncbi:hypothetical protein [Mucilaginibacter xinganensis]|uniref:Haem-binding uptake Tiki superfamily ChaN domain-containing protein n=1 Tax=Mucilaginibacter xinganensis TaxID=1234841 RepID=A0A223NXN5_9SPHI|nr:hypothetical protein [Mucilaginibacter xinganensis]ASU34348.1 hypothetical protein MuYL_2461 [Mucilaginibacter xinganensis]